MQSIGLQWTSPNTTVLQRQIRYVRAAAQGTYWVKSNAQLTDSITGLQPLTDYRIWVRDVCAAGDTGLWVGPFLATTSSVPCAILAAPYKEDFEGLNWFPNPNNQGAPNQALAIMHTFNKTGVAAGTAKRRHVFKMPADKATMDMKAM